MRDIEVSLTFLSMVLGKKALPLSAATGAPADTMAAPGGVAPMRAPGILNVAAPDTRIFVRFAHSARRLVAADQNPYPSSASHFPF
jgi:hypothetical protein